MLNTEIQDWLMLWHAPKMTARHFHKVLKNFKTPKHFLKMNQAEWSHLGFSTETIHFLKNPNSALPLIEKSLIWKDTDPNHHIVTFYDPNYPPLLKEIADPPPILLVKGKINTLSAPQISVVGSRKPTPCGLLLAKEFAYDLTLEGFTITSGLALGIDTAAHYGSLVNGQTIAVLGSGLNSIYPPQNKKLAEKIAEQGALVSEFPLTTPPKKENFPQRNRIVSGLSFGTLVVEAGIKSGSLITAKFAAEQGREVFAIPGSIKNSQASGCHFLIQQGAKLTSNIQHLLEELKRFDYVALENKKIAQEKKILACLGYEPTSIDIIKTRSGLEIAEINKILCNLLMKNNIGRLLNGYIKIK